MEFLDGLEFPEVEAGSTTPIEAWKFFIILQTDKSPTWEIIDQTFGSPYTAALLNLFKFSPEKLARIFTSMYTIDAIYI